jgi:hypothetical protein
MHNLPVACRCLHCGSGLVTRWQQDHFACSALQDCAIPTKPCQVNLGIGKPTFKGINSFDTYSYSDTKTAKPRRHTWEDEPHEDLIDGCASWCGVG